MLHPLIQEARGMCSDECPHVEIDGVLGEVLDAARDLEAEVDRQRKALERIANLKQMPALDPYDTQARCRFIARAALDARGEA
jgi:hypothetical protein